MHEESLLPVRAEAGARRRRLVLERCAHQRRAVENVAGHRRYARRREPADVDAATQQCKEGLGRPPRGKLGWLCLSVTESVRAGTIDISPDTFALFEQRTQQVYMCEILAAVAATCTAERCCWDATCCSS